MDSCKTCLRLYSLCKGCGPDDPGCQWHTDLDGTERMVPGPGGKPVRYGPVKPPEMVLVRAAEGGPTVEAPKETWEEMTASPPMSMGCQVAGPSPCRICAESERVVEEMTNGQTTPSGVDQEAVTRVMSELPPAKRTSEECDRVTPTVGWEGKPAKKGEGELELPPPCSPEEVEKLLQEGIEAAAEEHKRVAPMRARPSRMPLKSGQKTVGGEIIEHLDNYQAAIDRIVGDVRPEGRRDFTNMPPLTPVEVIRRYPEQVIVVVQKLMDENLKLKEALRFWDDLGVRIRREGTEPDGPENLPDNWPWICQFLKEGQRLAHRALGKEK